MEGCGEWVLFYVNAVSVVLCERWWTVSMVDRLVAHGDWVTGAVASQTTFCCRSPTYPLTETARRCELAAVAIAIFLYFFFLIF